MIKSLLLLSISFTSYASDIDLGRTHSNNLILRGDSCSELYKQRDAICSWSGKTYDENNTCKNDHKRNKKLVVSNCLPQFVKENANKKLYNHGANCWGTVMKSKGLTKLPRFFYSKEFKYWIYESKLCRPLEVGEKALPGDILNVYGPEYLFKTKEAVDESGIDFWNALYPNREVKSDKLGYTGYHHLLHSEIYLTDKISFGKDSPNMDDRFKFNKLREVYGRTRDINCQENQEESAHYREYNKGPLNFSKIKCKYFTKLYRCNGLDSLLSHNDLSDFEQGLVKEIKLIQSYQDRLFSLLSDKSFSLNKEEVRQIRELSMRASSRSLEELKLREESRLTVSILTLHFFSARALEKSLKFGGF